MSDPISNKGFGDAALAERVIEIYAKEDFIPDTDTLAPLGIAPFLAGKLATTMKGSGYRLDIVDPGEATQLENAGFSREFVKALRGDDGAKALRHRVRWLAAQATEKRQHPSVDAQLRRNYLVKIAQMTREGSMATSADIVPILVRIMRKDSERFMREDALMFLGTFRHDATGAVEEIIEASRNGDISPTKTAEALGRIGARPEIAIPYIFQLGKGISFEESYLFSRAIAFFGEQAFPWILEGLEDESRSTRIISLSTLRIFLYWGMKTNLLGNFFAPLISALEDPAPEIRREAAFTLSAMGEEAYIFLPILQNMMRHDPKEICRKAARDAIEQIESEVP